MPLLSTKCLQENYIQKADYEIFTAKTHCGNRASVQKQSNKCASLRKNEKILSKNNPKGYCLKTFWKFVKPFLTYKKFSQKSSILDGWVLKIRLWGEYSCWELRRSLCKYCWKIVYSQIRVVCFTFYRNWRWKCYWDNTTL